MRLMFSNKGQRARRPRGLDGLGCFIGTGSPEPKPGKLAPARPCCILRSGLTKAAGTTGIRRSGATGAAIGGGVRACPKFTGTRRLRGSRRGSRAPSSADRSSVEDVEVGRALDRLVRPVRAACRNACVCVFTPAYASVENTHVWPMAWADVVSGGLTPQAAIEKAFKLLEVWNRRAG